jgi:DNA invertase Pin-like site-specific DNA recombinase
MLSQISLQKIRPEHLERQAFIYVRQSTLMQVRNNTASTARQYDLVQRALDLGWERETVIVVDQDQGRSGASAVGRDGFQFLVAEVGLGHAGAVLSLEASRLARSNSDWYQLLEICALTDTLVIDEEGVYDPGQYNDRLLLGFKGTMSEAELHWLRQRLLGGKLEKASQGKLRFRLPAGYVYAETGEVVFDPDEQVQEAVRLVFALFEELNTAFGVVKHFRTHKLLFPQRFWGGDRDGELVWAPLRHSRVISLLHNPTYAGAYVYGRTKTRTKLLPGETPRIKGRTRRVNPEDWAVVIQNAHPAYITWEQFGRNQHQLDDNRTFRAEDRRGAVREGSALLQGIVLCGKCGRRMTIRYLALKECTAPSYECVHERKQYTGRSCQSIRGDGIDATVAQALLEAMQPAQLEVSLATLEQLESRARQIDQQWQLRLERSQYQADLARRRFMAVDPDNRLVARNLERDWNDKLLDIQALEREYSALPKPAVQLASPAERQRILSLAQDFPRLWQAGTTSQTERKQLLRFLVKDVTLTRQATTIHIGIRWQTEALTELEIPRLQQRAEVVRTKPAVVDCIRALAPTHTDQRIAEMLNQEGFTPGTGGVFTTSKINWIRYANQIPTGCPEAPGACPTGQRGDGRYSTKAVSELLNVDVSTVATWCDQGQLDCIRAKPRGPRWIKLTPALIKKLRKPFRQRWSRRSTSN